MAQKSRSKKIERQILRDVRHHPKDIVKHIGEIFNISRQAVNKHIQKLIREQRLDAEGSTRSRTYMLGPIKENLFSFDLKGIPNESRIYLEHFSWLFEDVAKNVEDIIFYGFAEIVNNAIDHSDGTSCTILIEKDLDTVAIQIIDDGEGIFRRIKRLSDLEDERQAILELSKGKFTTDPQNHSGQGIFFASRMFDRFVIESKGLAFSHQDGDKFDLFDEIADEFKSLGTAIFMQIALNSKRTDKQVFDEYTASEDEDFAFNRTVIPVRLARMGQEQLVSRSQAKRLLSRIENFKYVAFDFNGVFRIGQAFADEIFRVYTLRYPEVIIQAINTNIEIDKMIKRTKSS